MWCVTVSASVSQNSSRSFTGFPLLLAAIIAEFIPPIEVPATTSIFILSLWIAL
jgi:hypothetical protein